MSRKRSTYRPRRIDADPVGLAMTQAAALTPAQRHTLIGPHLTALDRLRDGEATDADWRHLVDMTKVAQELAALGIVSDHADEFGDAEHVLCWMHLRWHFGLPLEASALEHAALREAQVLHEIQLEHCSQAELQRAIERVSNVGRAAMAGSAAPGTIVCGMPPITTETKGCPT